MHVVINLKGNAGPELVIKLVKDGLIPENRIDTSVRQILEEEHRLGLFENPFVDAANAVRVVGKESFKAEGYDAQ